MDNDKSVHYCRVCGLDQGEPPWGENGNSPSFGICFCCGVEFGYGDCSVEDVRRTRKEWLDNGALWLDSEEKPDNWLLEEQLNNIPEEFR
ncbi:MAG: hypothetical protein WAM28_03000 [Chlamydiales bacterium]